MVCSCFVRFAHKGLMGGWGGGCMAAWLHGCMVAWLHGCMGVLSLVIVSDLLFYRFSILTFLFLATKLHKDTLKEGR
jgi:hypothetical protein